MFIGLFVMAGLVVVLLIGAFVLRWRLNRAESRKWFSRQ